MSVVNAVRQMIGGREADAEPPEPIPLTADEIHDLLSVQRRRLLLSNLVVDHDGVARFSELSNHVARVENGLDVAEKLSERQRKRVYVSLYQTHVPKLVDHGIVEYDDDHGIVTAKEAARRLVEIDRDVACVAKEAPA